MPAPVTAVPPDIELVVVTYLRRTGSRVVDLLGVDGQGNPALYTTVPKAPTFPLLRVVRFGGNAARSAPMHLLRPTIQLDAYGGSKADARRILDTAFAELADIAYHTHAGAVITGVELGSTGRYLPDNDYTPPRPRYSGDITVLVHPSRAA